MRREMSRCSHGGNVYVEERGERGGGGDNIEMGKRTEWS